VSSGLSARTVLRVEAGILANAALSGANTVMPAAEFSVSTSPACLTAVTRVDSSGLADAAVATGAVAMPVKLPAPDVGTEAQPGPKSDVVDAAAPDAAEDDAIGELEAGIGVLAADDDGADAAGALEAVRLAGADEQAAIAALAGFAGAGRRFQLLGESARGALVYEDYAHHPTEIAATLAAHRAAPSFTIVPAHDDLGSNTIISSPPDAVPLRFGEDSFFPHLEAARDRGIDPLIVRQPGIGMDIDNPVDLVTFLRMSPTVRTRTLAFLKQSGVADRLMAASQDFR